MSALRLWHASLGRRFTLLAGLAALVLACVSAGVSFWLAYRDAEADARATLTGLAEAVKNTAAVGAYARDTVLMDEVVNGLARNPLVGAVRIQLAEGSEAVRHGSTGRPAPTDAPALALSVPLQSPFNPQESLGALHVVADPTALSSKAWQQALRASIPTFAQVLLLTALLQVLATTLLSRPMARVAAQIAALEPGATQPLEVPRRHAHDEIGHLVRRTNQLLRANATALERERDLLGAVSAIEGQLRQLLNASSAAIFLLDPEGRLIQHNPTLLRLGLGSDTAALDPAALAEAVFDRPESFHALRRATLEQGWPLAADLRLRRAAPDGGECWVHVLLSPLQEGDGPALVEGVLYDVTQRRREEQRARHQAHHDPLTGVRNRAGLLAELDRAVAAGAGDDPLQPLSLLYLDLDGFKAVNDQHGHEAGDAVLREVAARLGRETRRTSDVVARLGGDEFVLLLHADAQEPWVHQLAWRLTRQLALPIALPGGLPPARVGASVGLAGLPQHARDRDGLLRAADQAMYRVKRHGKNGVATPEGVLPVSEAPGSAAS